MRGRPKWNTDDQKWPTDDESRKKLVLAFRAEHGRWPNTPKDRPLYFWFNSFRTPSTLKYDAAFAEKVRKRS